MDGSKQLWPWFVLCTVICWGAYVPFLHTGQKAFAPTNNAMRAFIFVGVAYFVAALAVLGYLLLAKSEPWQFNTWAVTLSTFAGLLGAVGALGVAFALMHGGRPIVVAPLVFAGAPIVNTLVSMIWHRPEKTPHPMFFAGIVVAAVGASIVLRFKPA